MSTIFGQIHKAGHGGFFHKRWWFKRWHMVVLQRIRDDHRLFTQCVVKRMNMFRTVENSYDVTSYSFKRETHEI